MKVTVFYAGDLHRTAVMADINKFLFLNLRNPMTALKIKVLKKVLQPDATGEPFKVLRFFRKPSTGDLKKHENLMFSS